MNSLKTLGLAAVAALALMALVGTGVASAESTTLCKVAESPCSLANMVTNGTEIKSTLKAGTEAVLKAGFGSVKCKKSEVSGKQEKTGGETEKPEHGGKLLPGGNITSLTFEECNCPVTVVKPGKLRVKWAEHEIEKVKVEVGEVLAEEFEVKVGGEGITCFLINNFECIYSGTVTEKLTIFNGNPAILKAEEAVIPRTGGKSGEFTCGNNGKWTAEYEVTTPKPLFVTKMATP